MPATITITIPTKFDPRNLPAWAQKLPAVIALCESDLAFRCDVCRARTPEMRSLLIRRAESAQILELRRKLTQQEQE